MKKLFSAAKAAHTSLRETQSAFFPTNQLPVNQSSSSSPSSVTAPTPLDVLRYRYHHGVNLEGIFVLDTWLNAASISPPDNPPAELLTLKALVKEGGVEKVRTAWEKRWNVSISDDEFRWLVQEAKCTSIRVPIGYYTLGKSFCRGTEFEDVAEIYVGAWAAVKRLVYRAKGFGVGVLIDLDVLPGGSNRANGHLWGNKKNLDLATKCAVFVAREVKSWGMEGVVGLQICSEAAEGAKGMYEWYENVISEIEKVDENLPIYVSDGWDLGKALLWSSGRKRTRNSIVVDTHKYWCFKSADRLRPPAEIIAEVFGELRQLDGKEGDVANRGEAQVIVGQYSCCLGHKNDETPSEEDQPCFQNQFGIAQSRRWQERCAGAYFWTFKLDQKDGKGWDFREEVKKGNIVPPPESLLTTSEVLKRAETAQDKQEKLLANASWNHEQFCNGDPEKRFERERYNDGWICGFEDALSFFTMRAHGKLGPEAGEGGDRIGCLEIWVKKRLFDSRQQGPSAWEWESGLRDGVRAFNNVVMAQ